ncbi:Staygreen protein [Dillenia turbinata]|uniref:Staygreen protein n=1 Tax=Dillenia turbinata TaxID=194707 RepID=A0AAN8VYZ7_9MAGN
MAFYPAFSFSPPLSQKCFSIQINNFNAANNKHKNKLFRRRPARLLHSSTSSRTTSYNTLVFQAARLLGPPARFEASKLKVVFTGEEVDMYSTIRPRTYTLSHCDLTADLTLSISNIISLDQLKGLYKKDDVVAEWCNVKGNMCLHVHCYVSGPNLLLDLAAEFRYHIFSKELPLVLKAVLHGDSLLFKEHPELMDAIVRVYFHSGLQKYNRVECWGPLKDAAERREEDQMGGLVGASKKDFSTSQKWGSPKSIFQALVTLLL